MIFGDYQISAIRYQEANTGDRRTASRDREAGLEQ
jgi:hypothetical protein